MEALHLPNNIKVHYAGSEQKNHLIVTNELGIRYYLYTAYSFVNSIAFKGKKIDADSFLMPQKIIQSGNHTIQDSGLFTLMFGAQKGKKDEAMINKWYDGLIEFSLKCSKGATCVEVDCQKVLGVEKAWEFRQRMRKDLPNNRIINVYHLEDGKYGLDRMIEFSDYIAISVPELRFAHKKKYVPMLAKYIKSKKPSIDIHLLGCTELSLLHECRFCTSADSTSHLSGARYGFISGNHVRDINDDKIAALVGKERRNRLYDALKPSYANTLILDIAKKKVDYERAAGNQDYYQIL